MCQSSLLVDETPSRQVYSRGRSTLPTSRASLAAADSIIWAIGREVRVMALPQSSGTIGTQTMSGASKRCLTVTIPVAAAGLLLAATCLVRGDEGLPDLTITLGASNVGSGLVVPSAGDGENLPEVVHGSPARRISGNGSSYMYVIVDHPAYAKGPVDVYVTVEFLDESFGRLGLEYDRGGNDGLAGHYVAAGEAIRLADSAIWRQGVYHLPALRLGHGQNWGADFRLTGRRLAVRRISISGSIAGRLRPASLEQRTGFPRPGRHAAGGNGAHLR